MLSKIEKPTQGVDFIDTENYANAKLEFFYYIPSETIRNKQHVYPVLICIPYLSGRGEDFVGLEFKNFAEKEGFIIIAPSFMWDKNNWNTQTSYQYPAAWSGNALIKIITKVEGKYNLLLSKFYLYGFSAGAQFALRYALWKPELCATCVAHGSGGNIIPEKKVDVEFFISVGKEDKVRVTLADTFYKYAKKIRINVIYKKYEGGHNLPKMQISDSMIFFKDIKTQRREGNLLGLK